MLPARSISTKNKHLLVIYSIPTRGFTAAVSVFMGTPPPKPLKCKIRFEPSGALIERPWADPTGDEFCSSCAIINLCCQTSSRRRFISVHSRSPFVTAIYCSSFREIKNPAYTAVSRVKKILFRSLPAYHQIIQIGSGFLPEICPG